MKKILGYAISVAILLQAVCIPAAANGTFEYTSDALGITLTLPAELKDDLDIQESDGELHFAYKPSISDNWTGKMFSIRVKSPKRSYFSREYLGYYSKIIAVSRDAVYVYVPLTGGVDSGEAHRDEYSAVCGALGANYLMDNIKVPGQLEIPESCFGKAAGLTAVLNEVRPNDAMTRIEASELIYALFGTNIEPTVPACPFKDIESASDYAKALAYLYEYGIITGYPDGTFRPNDTVTRAEFVVMLQRALFIPYPWWYGEEIHFSDVCSAHWAWNYLNCAVQYGWLTGYPDGTIHPDENITRAEAALVIGRVENAR